MACLCDETLHGAPVAITHVVFSCGSLGVILFGGYNISESKSRSTISKYLKIINHTLQLSFGGVLGLFYAFAALIPIPNRPLVKGRGLSGSEHWCLRAGRSGGESHHQMLGMVRYGEVCDSTSVRWEHLMKPIYEIRFNLFLDRHFEIWPQLFDMIMMTHVTSLMTCRIYVNYPIVSGKLFVDCFRDIGYLFCLQGALVCTFSQFNFIVVAGSHSEHDNEQSWHQVPHIETVYKIALHCTKHFTSS